MKLSDLKIGTSLHFAAPLGRGPDRAVAGEYACSFLVSGQIVPTPEDEWHTLRELLGQPERPPGLLPRDFTAAYVPYTDGRIHYHEGNEAVLSGQYSGCLMAVYEAAHQRRVAHVPKSNSIANDCIGEFRDFFAAHSTLGGPDKQRVIKTTHELTHFFQPFLDRRDSEVQLTIIGKLMQSRFIKDPYGLSVFGLVTAPENECISLWLVKSRVPPARGGEMWHLMLAAKRSIAIDFKAFADKLNRTNLAVQI